MGTGCQWGAIFVLTSHGSYPRFELFRVELRARETEKLNTQFAVKIVGVANNHAMRRHSSECLEPHRLRSRAVGWTSFVYQPRSGRYALFTHAQKVPLQVIDTLSLLYSKECVLCHCWVLVELTSLTLPTNVTGLWPMIFYCDLWYFTMVSYSRPISAP